MRIKLPHLSIKERLLEFDDWVTPTLGETSRRYLLLDFIAITGKRLSPKDLRGAILIPGFGPRFGVSLSEVADSILPRAGLFGGKWSADGLVLKDIEFLAKMGWIDQR